MLGESRLYIVGADRRAWRELAKTPGKLGYQPNIIGRCREVSQSIQDDLKVDLVLIDADSVEGCATLLAKRMRADARLSGIPIIVAGATINQETVQQHLALRVKDIVLLPAISETLQAKVDGANRAGRYSVLIVDDGEGIRQILTGMLEMERFRVYAVASDESALQALKDLHFDIVVSDIAMPGMDGIELMERIQTSSRDIPVVLVTGNPGRHGPEPAFASGADGYFVKPLNRVELGYALSQLLTSRIRQTRSIATSVLSDADGKVDLPVTHR